MLRLAAAEATAAVGAAVALTCDGAAAAASVRAASKKKPQPQQQQQQPQTPAQAAKPRTHSSNQKNSGIVPCAAPPPAPTQLTAESLAAILRAHFGGAPDAPKARKVKTDVSRARSTLASALPRESGRRRQRNGERGAGSDPAPPPPVTPAAALEEAADEVEHFGWEEG
jgi:hypothetical protein